MSEFCGIGKNIKKHKCCRCCEPDSGYDVEMIKIEEEKRKKVHVFSYGDLVTDQLALLLKGKGISKVVFGYSGVPKEYLQLLERHGIDWVKEKKGLSNVAVAEEGIFLVGKWFQMMGIRFELNGKNALVLGSEGFIGKSLCRILRGFGCNVLNYDIVFREKRHLDLWLDFADLIFVCTPELSEPLLGEMEFGLMNNNPLIVNVSGRVSLVNEKVLHKYLDAGKVLGYACDEESEPFKNCFFQKHQGAKSIEATERRLVEKEKNINLANSNNNRN